MAHSYSSVTKSDNTFTAVTDVTPDGTIEEKFTWNYIVPSYDTWLELLAKEHWADWYFGTVWTDDWTSLTIPDYAYTSVSPLDSSGAYNVSSWSNWLNLGMLTWNNFYETGEVKWSHWLVAGSEYMYKNITTPSKTYQEVTV